MCVGRLTQRVAGWTGALAAVTGVLALIPGSASAARAGLCTNTRGAPAIIFGPDSFFRPSNVQGPTSFKENRRQTQATYPLYRGTSGNQEVDYVITDASSLPAARSAGRQLRAEAPRGGPDLRGTAVWLRESLGGGGIDCPRPPSTFPAARPS